METIKVKLPAINGIAFTITPEQAMELIKNLSSYAIDGKPFDVSVHTQSSGWDIEAPIAAITVGGFFNLNAPLKWSYTDNGDKQVIHYDTKPAGA
jgi:hypothetical protein